MFANTLAITIGGSAKTLTRVNQDNYGSVYQDLAATYALVLRVRNTTEKSAGSIYDRHNAELQYTVYATADAPEKHYTVSTTFRTRRVGGDPVALAASVRAFMDLADASLVDGMVKGES